MDEYQFYNGVWDYIANSSCAAQATMIGISAAVVTVGVYTINACKKLKNLRKSKKSKLENSVSLDDENINE